MTQHTVDLSTSDELEETRQDGVPAPAAPRPPSTQSLEARATLARVEQELLGTQKDPPTMGRFRLLRRIGSGAMGVVFEAHDPDLDRRVALKVLRPEIAARPGLRARSRMLREAQALARIRHPHVTAVYEVGTRDDAVFIAMELVEGRTLKQWVRARRRGYKEILEVFLQAGRGLQAVHDAGLVHRDFKPDNLIVDDNGEARVVDFGLARHSGLAEFLPTLDDGDHDDDPHPAQLELTATGAMLGTPAYMAPEQFDGSTARPASDQFSFCVALFEALYGRRPYPGNDLPSLQRSLLEGTPVAHRGNVPKRLYRVLCRGVSVDPQERFRDMRQLLAALQACLDRRGFRRPMAWMAGLTLAGLVAAFGPPSTPSDSPVTDDTITVNAHGDEAEPSANDPSRPPASP